MIYIPEKRKKTLVNVDYKLIKIVHSNKKIGKRRETKKARMRKGWRDRKESGTWRI